MKRVSKRPLSESKVGLLAAAGELFAERGMDAVALREITERAGTNVAAVNYHFGSREGLIVNLLEMVLLPLWEERQLRMEAVEKKWGNKSIPLEELVDVWVRPLEVVMRRFVLGEAVGLRVTGRALLIPEADWPGDVRVLASRLRERWVHALQRSLAEVSGEELGWRVDWIHGGLASLLLGCGESWKVKEQERVVAAFVRFAIHGLRGAGKEAAPAKAKQKGAQETFDF